MLNWLNSFTVLIQTISAVNILYIATDYIKSVFKLFFDEKKLVDKVFVHNTDQINADIQSLKSINIKDYRLEDGRDPQSYIAKQVSDYEALDTEWDQKLDELKQFIADTSEVKGTKSLFLVISLFCFFTIFNLSMMGGDTDKPRVFWYIFTMLLSISTLVYSVVLSFIIWKNKWKERDADDCYKGVVKHYFFIVLGSFGVSAINSGLGACFGFTPIPDLWANILLSLCVVLPFYPCLMSAIYVLYKEKGIRKKAVNETTPLLERQSKLHKDKEAFDKIGEFYPKPPVFG